MSGKQIPCLNLQVSGCQGVVFQRGNTLCDSCIEQRKNSSKKRENTIDDFLTRNKVLEMEIVSLKAELENQKNKISQLDKNNFILEDCLAKQRSENELLVKNKIINELKTRQLSSDLEQAEITIKKLNEEINFIQKNK